MELLSVGLGFLVNFLNFADEILQRFGIKICDVNRGYITRGMCHLNSKRQKKKKKKTMKKKKKKKKQRQKQKQKKKKQQKKTK